jgi:hypothetical protein
MKLHALLSTAFLSFLAASCAHPPQGAASTGPAVATSTAAQAMPTTPGEALEMRRAGREWSNCEIRVYYNQLVATIPARVASLQEEGASMERRARSAFTVRHNARVTTRAMMSRQEEVEELRARDMQKYGHPDGPTFEQLVEKGRAKGLPPDAVYQDIIDSAQRTDAAVNRECGIETK